MADGITVDTSEVTALAAKFGLAAAAITPAAADATKESAEQIEVRATNLAPRLTGELAAGYEVEGSGLSWTVINRTRQAIHQEFGNSRHGPQPSLYPSANAVEPEYIDDLEEVAVDVLK